MKKYREEDAMINGIRAGHHGPWTEAEEHFPPVGKRTTRMAGLTHPVQVAAPIRITGQNSNAY
jgi:hypothetical protein